MSLALSRSDSDLLARVSDFPVAEAELFDGRLLDTWLALFGHATRYRVLPLQEQSAGQTPEGSLYIIDDDHVCLRERVDSTLNGYTWVEQLRSRTRRLVGNVRLKRVEGELVSSRSSFVIHQPRSHEAWNSIGEANHVLCGGPGGLRAVLRETRLDHEAINTQRHISVIL